VVWRYVTVCWLFADQSWHCRHVSKFAYTKLTINDYIDDYSY